MPIARAIAHRLHHGLRRRTKDALVRVGLRDPAPAAPISPQTAPPAAPPAPQPATAAPAEDRAADVAVADPSADPTAAVLDHDTRTDPTAAVLDRDAVETLLDDMVRPALQADGGDITLVRVEPEGDIYVELVGACSTCPSATVTMRMGIERLMQEELPGFRSLIEVNGMGSDPMPFPG